MVLNTLAEFEKEVLRHMLAPHFSETVIESILASPVTSYEYTIAGYYLGLENEVLEDQRKVIATQGLFGKSNRLEVGFIINISGPVLVIECHSWGSDNLPEDFRNQPVEIIYEKD